MQNRRPLLPQGQFGGQFRPPAGTPIAVMMGENGQFGAAGECFRRANRSAAPEVGGMARPRCAGLRDVLDAQMVAPWLQPGWAAALVAAPRWPWQLTEIFRLCGRGCLLARTVRTVRLFSLNPPADFVSTIGLGGWTRAWASAAHLLCGFVGSGNLVTGAEVRWGRCPGAVARRSAGGRRGSGDGRGQSPPGPGLGLHQPGRRLRARAAGHPGTVTPR